MGEPVDEDEKALRPIPKKMFVMAFIAGGIVAAGLAFAAYRAEQNAAAHEEPAPEAAATETGGELDPAVREELEALDEREDGSWLEE